MMTLSQGHALADILVHREGCAGPAPTFSLSNAPVYDPYAFYREDSDRSNQSTNASSGNYNFPALDIDMVENTYQRVGSPQASPSQLSLQQNIPQQPENEDPLETPREAAGPRITVSLNQKCCAPGEVLRGTVFLDLATDLYSYDENDCKVPAKILVTFYGVEQVKLLGEGGVEVTKQHDCFTETKELGNFCESIPAGMHEFHFGFAIPTNAPPSCCVNLNNNTEKLLGGSGEILYFVVVSVEGVLADESLVCSSPVIIREYPGQGNTCRLHQGQDVSNRSNSTGPSSNSSRTSPMAASEDCRERRSGHIKRHFLKFLPHMRPHIRAKLQEDTVPFSGRIKIDFDLENFRRNQRKRAIVKLIQKVELKTDDHAVQQYDSTLYIADFEMGSCKTIELMLPSDNNELSPSVESQLFSCQYMIQIKTRSSFRVLSRPVSVYLPVRLVYGEDDS